MPSLRASAQLFLPQVAVNLRVLPPVAPPPGALLVPNHQVALMSVAIVVAVAPLLGVLRDLSTRAVDRRLAMTTVDPLLGILLAPNPQTAPGPPAAIARVDPLIGIRLVRKQGTEVPRAPRARAVLVMEALARRAPVAKGVLRGALAHKSPPVALEAAAPPVGVLPNLSPRAVAAVHRLGAQVPKRAAMGIPVVVLEATAVAAATGRMEAPAIKALQRGLEQT